MVKQFGNIQFLILSIGAVVFFTLPLVTGNTMTIAIRERTGELAIFKAIGFSDFRLLHFVLAESLVVSLIGSTLGMIFVLIAVPMLSNALTGFIPPLVLSSPILLSCRWISALRTV